MVFTIKKTIAFIIILAFVSCVNKDPYPYKVSDFRTELEEPLKKLAQEKELPVRDTIARNYVRDHSSKEELLQLLNCNNPLLRVVAYRAIVNRKEKDYFKILLGHLNDTTKVTWWYYEDAAGEFTVSDLLVRKAEEANKLSKQEKKILVDSVLLKHAYLETSIWMIQDIEPQEKYYSIIKNKSKIKTDRCGDHLSACYALSKFKKKEDLVFLKNTFNDLESPCEDWIFKAIENNPNEIYFPVLEKYFKEVIRKKKPSSYEDLKYYCRAVAVYKNEKSLALLTELLKKSNYPDPWYFTDNQEYTFKAIHKYKSPVYQNLYKELKPKMSDFVFKYLDEPDYDDRKTW
ncbi:hypothetical protein [uncultured Flavobacterium sp.]|uniref:hypothetical protein n=1 Tax=uncultured Flavobacterium sp. TaxID=165435 RepID=UPI003081B873